ncbi:hypothetical protein Tco_0763478 [Tanacetum coccineum]
MDNNLPNAPNWAFNPLPEYSMGPLPNPSLEAYQKRVQELTDEANVLRHEISEGSEEFDQEMLKVRDVIIEQGHELGRREAQDFSPVIEALSIWIPAPELSYALLHYVLPHGGGGQEVMLAIGSMPLRHRLAVGNNVCFPSQSKRVKGMVITPSGHITCPAKPIRGDVGDRINAFASSALMTRGSSPLQCSGIGSSLKNAISVLVDSASGW